MWWGGFLLCGLLLILVAIPFFSFPKTLQREKEKIRIIEKNKPITQKVDDSGYGKDVKGKFFYYLNYYIFKISYLNSDVTDNATT